MSGEDLTGWVPVTIDGELVGRASIEYGVATVQIRPEMEARFRQGIMRGLSVAPAAEEAGCICDYENIEGARYPGGAWEILRTVWNRDPACQFPHVGGRVAGGQSDLLPAEALKGPSSSAGRPCGCLPGEGCAWCRNSVAYALDPREVVPRFGANWRAEHPGQDVAVVPARVEGVEVPALMCASDTHEVPVPAVSVGTFRVPWWPEGRVQRTAYCALCAYRLGELAGYFVPDTRDGGSK
jgi:hypothetical protein